MPETHTQNLLARETSPYLLQHADNPVHWMPWGEPAFEKARTEKKLIFLSIGYSTCHWCHVMAEESFENKEIATLLNDNFICIKVDREERPDVDLTYMTFVQMSTGSGGWPLNIFLTHDRKPVYGGTYWPPKDLPGRAGLPRVCREVIRAWIENPETLTTRADSVVLKLNQAFSPETLPNTTTPLHNDLLPIIADYFSCQFDHHYGGFGGSPKFPRPSAILLLLLLHRHFLHTDPNRAHSTLDMALTTLRAMARGGIHDHLGGGFHRYTVDETWHLPHFEKMLCDQALLADCYTTAFRLTHHQEFHDTAHSIFTYLLRDLLLPQGAFASAEDADSYTDSRRLHKAEGAYYLWHAAEIEKELGPQHGPIFRFTYGVQKSGNIRETSDPENHFKNKNVLFLSRSPTTTAQQFQKQPPEITATLDHAKIKLLTLRQTRIRPHRDDKILTAWNALTISALSRSATTLNQPQLLATAKTALHFIRNQLWPNKTQLLRTFRGTNPHIQAFSADYALLIQAMLDYYEATFDLEALQDAFTLQNQMDALFLDKTHGGYFSVRADQNHAILSIKEDTDGAEPSPNSVAAMNLLRLGKMLNHKNFLTTANQLFHTFTAHIKENAYSAPALIEALHFHLNSTTQIVIAAPDPTAASTLANVIRHNRPPNTILLHTDNGPASAWLNQHNPTLTNMHPINNQPTVFVCQNFTCQHPVTTIPDLENLLNIKKNHTNPPKP